MIKDKHSIETMSYLCSRHTPPRMVKVRQIFPDYFIDDIPKEIDKQLTSSNFLSITNKIKKGDVVAITCGSRGISNIALITKEIVSFVKSKGGSSFCFSSYGKPWRS
jgi:hypothetical protein